LFGGGRHGDDLRCLLSRIAGRCVRIVAVWGDDPVALWRVDVVGMRITKVSVEKLFGIFDHEIPLNLDDRITIIHGPNGYGKTIILKMMYGLFNDEYSDLRSIPYKRFCIELDDGSRLVIDKSKSGDYRNTVSHLSCDFHRAGYELSSLHIEFGVDDHVSLVSTPWFERIRNQISVYLIDTQRLLSISNKQAVRPDRQGSLIQATVSACSVELVQYMRDKLAEYASVAQSLDRTFPARVLNQKSSNEITNEYVKEKLNNLERRRNRLIEAGLLEKNEEQNLLAQQQDMDGSMRNILSVYAEDGAKKLDVFGDFVEKIALFREIVNSRFMYKVMTIDYERGFVFTLNYPNGYQPSLAGLSPTALSSGEQHELVLLYELLFKVQPKSLVLIDEPELSLHIGWQVNFLRDLQEITKLADIDILIATHAPDLIADRWDLTVELKGIS
jgi:energy-coupling factor transporter ATP-binding protein EcfA2